MRKITAKELRDLYFDFFGKKGHKVIPSAPLVPEGDPSTLFISAGMHPLVPYLLGEEHPLGRRLVGVQECLRTDDIGRVGNEFHHTWFEMLGNWSLGDYFKKEAIGWSFEFLTEVLKIDPQKLFVTCFAGDENAPRDRLSAEIWQKLGLASERIHFLPKKDNWWGPVGEAGPCGPDTEMFVDIGRKPCGQKCIPGCSCGKYAEVWNDVFMEFEKTKKGKLLPLKQKNVDTGMGVERTLAIVSGFSDDYLTEIWQPIVRVIERISGKSYQEEKQAIRIIADHLRAAVFLVADGVLPGNKEQAYVLRRLLRRSIRQGRLLAIEGGFIVRVAQAVLANQENYAGEYPELKKNEEIILSVLKEEETRFAKTLDRGLKKLTQLFSQLEKEKKKILPGEQAFWLYESFGFPLELIEEEAFRQGFGLEKKGFWEKQKEHQQKSRQRADERFRGGLADSSKEAVAYHTATHLLHQALRQILGSHVSQVGSAITKERLRFDFTHPAALTEEEIRKIEEMVNKVISQDLPVRMEVVSLEESRRRGALSFFKDRYPKKVKVYSIGGFSKEVCGGPHVESTGQLGRFFILKQESCGSGKRRIYAKLDQ